MKPTVLPNSFLRRMAPQDRKPLGKAGLTSEEAIEKARAGEEARLQGEIRQYLNLHDIQYINPSMRRRSALPPGWADFSFVYRKVPIAVECKTEEGRLSTDQRAMRTKLIRDGWTYILAQSLADVQRVFREIDAQIK